MVTSFFIMSSNIWNHYSNEDPSKIRYVDIVTDEYVQSHATSIFNVDTNQEEYIIQDKQNQQYQNQTSYQPQVPSFIPQNPKTTTYEDIGTSPIFNNNLKRNYAEKFDTLLNEVTRIKNLNEKYPFDFLKLQLDLKSFSLNEKYDLTDDETSFCEMDKKNDLPTNEKNDEFSISDSDDSDILLYTIDKKGRKIYLTPR